MNKYKITLIDGSVKNVVASEFDIQSSAVVFKLKKTINNIYAVGVSKKNVLAIAGSEVKSVELIEEDIDENQQ